MYSVKYVRVVSGYSTRSDLKAARLGADSFLAGRTFHSRIVFGKKRVRQYLVSKYFLEQPVLASGSCIAAIYKTACIGAYKIDADLVHQGQQAVSSTLFEGLPVEV